MPYTDKFMKVQAIEIIKSEEVSESDESVSYKNSYTLFNSYINPFEISRFEPYALSDSMTVLYLRNTDPLILNVDCESFVYMVDKHISGIIG
jgi:hypothetical protein